MTIVLIYKIFTGWNCCFVFYYIKMLKKADKYWVLKYNSGVNI